MHEDCPKVLVKIQGMNSLQIMLSCRNSNEFLSYLDVEGQEDSKKHDDHDVEFHKTLKCMWKTLIHKNKVHHIL